MLVFVDFEHADGYERKHGQRILAARTWITYRLEDLTGQHCHLVRYDRVDQALLDGIDATSIFISGNSIDPERYAASDLEPLQAIVRETQLSIFGFCGGFQLLAEALGADVVPLEQQPEHVDDPSMVQLDDGRPFEYGYHPIELASGATDHPLFAGLGDAPVFRHAHGLHVPDVPDGFDVVASTPATPIQVAVHDGRKIVGTQFHPEYWTDEHPDGRTLIANFCAWAGLTA